MRKKDGQTLNTGKKTYTITITIPKIRIKVPKATKVVANAMQKKRQRVPPDGIKPCRSRSRNRWANPKKLFPKVTSIMSNVFGSTKRTRNNVFSWNARGGKNHRRGYKSLSDVKFDDAEDESPLPLGGFLGWEMKQGLQRKVSKHSSFSTFLNKKLGLKFSECKVKKVSFGGCTSANGVFSSHKVLKKHPSFPANTFITTSKMLSTRRRNYVKTAGSLSSNVITEDEQRARDKERAKRENWELCKKRILMGAKCKPLNHSGYLRYDKDGILLPDELF